jgi:hypothetical protein
VLNAASGCTGFIKAAFGLRVFFFAVAIFPPSRNDVLACLYQRAAFFATIFLRFPS